MFSKNKVENALASSTSARLTEESNLRNVVFSESPELPLLPLALHRKCNKLKLKKDKKYMKKDDDLAKYFNSRRCEANAQRDTLRAALTMTVCCFLKK